MGLLKTRLTWNVKEDNGVIQVSFFGWRPPGVGVRKVNCGLANGQRDWHTHTHGAEEEDDDDNKEAQTANRSFAWSRRVHTLTKGHHQGNRMFCNSLGCCVFYSLSLVRQTHTPNTRTTTHTPHALCLSQVCCWGFCCSQNCCQGFVPVTLPGLLQFEPSARAFILLLLNPRSPVPAFRRSRLWRVYRTHSPESKEKRDNSPHWKINAPSPDSRVLNTLHNNNTRHRDEMGFKEKRNTGKRRTTTPSVHLKARVVPYLA